MSNYVVIFSAGKGQRMGSKTPKQFLIIDKKPILAYTIEQFNNLKEIKGIILVVSEDQIKTTNLIIKKYKFNKINKVVIGGKTALESQFNGIKWLKDNVAQDNDFIIIHDGVRPLINRETIIKAIKLAKKKGNAVTINPASETVSINCNKEIDKIMPREDCSIVRAPQIYKLKDIYNAHLKTVKSKKSYVDSASMMNSLGYKLNVINGPVENIKVTTEHDFIVCKYFLNKRKYNG